MPPRCTMNNCFIYGVDTRILMVRYSTQRFCWMRCISKMSLFVQSAQQLNTSENSELGLRELYPAPCV